MIGNVSTSVVIGAQLLKRYAVGDTPEARFKEIIKPRHLAEGCWMTSNEDEEFRCAVGGLILSYETGSPEQERVLMEMQQINRLSTVLQAATLGMGIGEIPETPEGFAPIRLLDLWRARDKR